ncbi:hypothetical protein FACS1894151_10270 [Spirochaetia bacterium]|nr:hypothetical protein FACS1894151_10270 [Spirochaetia bacterium]
MPLSLTYKAMQRGPVPIEIYENRNNPGFFSSVVFEPVEIRGGITGYIIKPKGKFNPDYFAEAELEEMNNLIEMFAQIWIGASEMSDASHQAIRAWKITYSHRPNDIIDPAEEFNRDISVIPESELSSAEEKFLIHQKTMELTHCLTVPSP